MATEKKADAAKDPKNQQQQQADERARTQKSILKPAKKGAISSFVSWLMVLFLSMIFFALLLVIVVLFDFLGIIRVRDVLPGSLLENNYVKAYIRESNLIKNSEENKIKALISEQESSYQELSEKIKHKEVNIDEKLTKLSLWEKELRDRELDIIAKEKTLAQKTREFEEAKKQKNISDQTLDQFSRVYERMDPQLAAEALGRLDDQLLIDIISRMKEKKGALILEKLPANKVSKITEEIKRIAVEKTRLSQEPPPAESASAPVTGETAIK